MVAVSNYGEGRNDELMLLGLARNCKLVPWFIFWRSLPKEIGCSQKLRCSKLSAWIILSKENSHSKGCTSPITFCRRLQFWRNEGTYDYEELSSTGIIELSSFISDGAVPPSWSFLPEILIWLLITTLFWLFEESWNAVLRLSETSSSYVAMKTGIDWSSSSNRDISTF